MATLLASAKRQRRNSPHSSLRMILAAKDGLYELRTVELWRSSRELFQK